MKSKLKRLVPVVPVVLAAGLLVWLAPALLAAVLVVTLGVLLAVAVLVVSGLRVLRRTAEQVLADRPHLTRLGHRFEHRYRGLRVTASSRDETGELSISLTWDDRQTIELDGQGLPEGVTQTGPGSATWVLPTPVLAPEELDALLALPETTCDVVEEGQIGLEGEVVTRRELTAANGVVLQMAPTASAHPAR